VAVVAFEAVSVGWLFSAITGIEGPVLYTLGGAPVHALDLLIGLAGTAFLGYLNSRGASASARFQTVCTVLLIILSLVFVLAALAFGHAANLRPLFAPHPLAGVRSVLVATPFLLAGFNVIAQALGESAERAELTRLGFIIGASIIAAGVFYIAIIVGTVLSLPRAQLLAADLPAAAALRFLFASEWATRAVLGVALLGLVTTWNAVLFGGAHVADAMSRARLLPSWLSGDASHGISARAIAAVCIVAAVGTLAGRAAVLPIVSINGFVNAAFFALVCWGCVRLRRTAASAERPFSVPGGIPTMWAGVAISLGILVIAVRDSFAESQGKLPAQWLVIAAWAMLGGLAQWHTRTRAAVR
jgi:amino acid transporter